MPSRADLLRSLPYFAALGIEEINRIDNDLTERSFARGEVLFLEGEPCQGLYIVASGRIRVFKSSAEGREQVILIANVGDTFNDAAVFDGGASPASASAMEPSKICIVPRETVLSLLADCPSALDIITFFATRLRHLTKLVEELSFHSVISRLAKALLDLAVVEEGGSPVRRLTQEEMAAMVGTVRDVIGRTLRTLVLAGAIKIEGDHILIIDAEMLHRMI